MRTSTSTVNAITSRSWFGEGTFAPPSSRNGPHRLEHAECQPAEHCARDVADPAQHRGGERLDAGQEAHEPVDLVEHEGVEDPGRAGEQPADREGRAR